LSRIKERWKILQSAKEAYFKKEALRDELEETILGPDELDEAVEGPVELDGSDDSIDRIREEDEDELHFR
jgi:hypothetical protein